MSRRIARRVADALIVIVLLMPIWLVIEFTERNLLAFVVSLGVVAVLYVVLRRHGGHSPFSRTFHDAFADDVPRWWPGRRRSELEQQRQSGDGEHDHDDQQRDLTQ